MRNRCAAEGLQVLGFRFAGDRNVPADRFRYLREALDQVLDLFRTRLLTGA